MTFPPSAWEIRPWWPQDGLSVERIPSPTGDWMALVHSIAEISVSLSVGCFGLVQGPPEAPVAILRYPRWTLGIGEPSVQWPTADCCAGFRLREKSRGRFHTLLLVDARRRLHAEAPLGENASNHALQPVTFDGATWYVSSFEKSDAPLAIPNSSLNWKPWPRDRKPLSWNLHRAQSLQGESILDSVRHSLFRR